MKTHSATYRFAVVDLTFTICLDLDKDKQGNPINDHYIVKSLRVEDSFSKAAEAFEVCYIFSKANDENKYKRIEYADNRFQLSGLPKSILDMLEIES